MSKDATWIKCELETWQTDRWADGQAGKQAGGWAGRQAGRKL